MVLKIHHDRYRDFNDRTSFWRIFSLKKDQAVAMIILLMVTTPCQRNPETATVNF